MLPSEHVEHKSIMTQSKPTILIIHGAWHHPAYFDLLSNALLQKGYGVSCPLLPTCNNAVPPNMKFEDDIKLTRDTATRLADEGKEIVILMHSYGGVVGTDALYDLSLQDRGKSGKIGGVRRLLYMCAFIPRKGESLAGIFGGGLPPWLEPKDDGLIHIHDPKMHFYNDLLPDDAKKFAAQLVVHPTSAQWTGVTHEAFREIPVTYLLCENDQGLPLEVQKMMCARVEASGVKVDYETCSAGHSPFLSMPDELAKIVSKVAEI